MGNTQDDLDKFLKTEGIKIIMDSDGVRTEPYEPLTVEDIDGFGSMNLKDLDQARLEDLLDKAEELRDRLEDKLSETEDFMDRIQERLDELEDAESEKEGFIIERISFGKGKP